MFIFHPRPAESVYWGGHGAFYAGKSDTQWPHFPQEGILGLSGRSIDSKRAAIKSECHPHRSKSSSVSLFPLFLPSLSVFFKF